MITRFDKLQYGCNSAKKSCVIKTLLFYFSFNVIFCIIIHAKDNNRDLKKQKIVAQLVVQTPRIKHSLPNFMKIIVSKPHINIIGAIGRIVRGKEKQSHQKIPPCIEFGEYWQYFSALLVSAIKNYRSWNESSLGVGESTAIAIHRKFLEKKRLKVVTVLYLVVCFENI